MLGLRGTARVRAGVSDCAGAGASAGMDRGPGSPEGAHPPAHPPRRPQNINRQAEQKEAVGRIGEDLFAIALVRVGAGCMVGVGDCRGSTAACAALCSATRPPPSLPSRPCPPCHAALSCPRAVLCCAAGPALPLPRCLHLCAARLCHAGGHRQGARPQLQICGAPASLRCAALRCAWHGARARLSCCGVLLPALPLAPRSGVFLPRPTHPL